MVTDMLLQSSRLSKACICPDAFASHPKPLFPTALQSTVSCSLPHTPGNNGYARLVDRKRAGPSCSFVKQKATQDNSSFKPAIHLTKYVRCSDSKYTSSAGKCIRVGAAQPNSHLCNMHDHSCEQSRCCQHHGCSFLSFYSSAMIPGSSAHCPATKAGSQSALTCSSDGRSEGTALMVLPCSL